MKKLFVEDCEVGNITKTEEGLVFEKTFTYSREAAKPIQFINTYYRVCLALADAKADPVLKHNEKFIATLNKNIEMLISQSPFSWSLHTDNEITKITSAQFFQNNKIEIQPL